MDKKFVDVDSSLYEEKGQAAGAVNAIIILIVGVGVSVMVLIFIGALGGQTYNLVEPDIDAIYGVVVNESTTGVVDTVVNLANDAIQSGTFILYNTSLIAVPASNYSIDLSHGAYVLLDDVSGTTLWANYTHGTASIQTAIKAGITSGFDALEQTGDYLPIIVLAVVISLVLFLVLGFTAFGGGMGGSGRTAL